MNKDVRLTLIGSTLPPTISVKMNGSNTVQGRIAIEDENSPRWVTESGNILSVDESSGTSTVSVLATPSTTGDDIRYRILPSFDGVTGLLPHGFRLDAYSGVISGSTKENIIADDVVPFFDNELPKWSGTEGTIAKTNELSAFSYTFSASTGDGGTDMSYHLVGGSVPYGLFLNPVTGNLNGIVGEIIDGVELEPTELPKPRWTTLSGVIGIYGEREAVDVGVAARHTESENQILYHVVNGNLPNGLKLNPYNGKIDGSVYENLTDRDPSTETINFTRLLPTPVWVTERSEISTFLEGDVVNHALVVEHPELYGKITYTISENNLPFGLFLNPITGVISGTIDEIYDVKTHKENFPVITTIPQWSTVAGSLGEFNERTNISVTVGAESRNFKYANGSDTKGTPLDVLYSVVKGELPFGLTISAYTGLISGSVYENIVPITPNTKFSELDNTNPPVWNIPAGKLAKVPEKATVNLKLDGAAFDGSALTYYIIDGHIPHGLFLNSVSGAITGTTDENTINEPEELLDQGSPTFLNESDILVGTEVGNTVDISLLVDIVAGRSVKSFMVVSGNLPYGLTLNALNGTISGKISDITEAGDYVFSVMVIDSSGLKSTKTFTINVSNIEELV